MSGTSSSSRRSPVMGIQIRPRPYFAMKLTAFGRHLFGRQRQIAFVFAIFVVADDDHLAGADRVDRVLNRRKRPVFPSPTLRDFELCCHGISPVRSARSRQTSPPRRGERIFPTMSHSRLTRSPGRAARKFVCAHVNGTIWTSNVLVSSFAIVRLMPSTAIDPR